VGSVVRMSRLVHEYKFSETFQSNIEVMGLGASEEQVVLFFRALQDTRVMPCLRYEKASFFNWYMMRIMHWKYILY
jgi:hypothetical protein